MKQIIYFAQIIIGILLVTLIILQAKGTGLGSTFGSSMGMYSTRRGAEKVLFILTIILSFLFIISSLLGVIV
ncbi:preprotein translocase subunit SecG [Candidatus Daviesbacteria bacterium RIFCSPHIGHO2_01_FULL_44_29]|uniref:Protein-export membrane protein SecG n=1 Tax=Candidatus Daviesbacteria bacterium RIFCSPHIGHO2_02_FULL_43_12 TaxID=1797776 RepID=A0A1F5KKH2_9BACT|nr:MAG: preprotein translocase subunit SecG [Candidatus Daviesbacteria bacterium RIFCSPHIGHO2_01_FULL_44_29]OGE39589.1 MAG: preprotein translocase subunit SecG [Candidatus Daviesbacteria bacterium RIFCSPHIGHO2_12_FULL_47_45]OGE41423.1 MAG: preprotein translocase subunit SecG [Candidatus Daviesbacteria bacterium RIFCSPHIGHO2_02_FULL_43_12]OGE69623.1 MAG: preprotein translocase subunit SecG [Candidatus Daviesbacteria bacterium RIFCSPLOWO2_01_FULL_43_15]